MCLLDEGRDTFDTPGGKPLVESRHQLASNAKSTVRWANGKPVDISAPTVERANHRTDNLSRVLSDQKYGVFSTNHTNWASRIPKVIAGLGGRHNGLAG